MIDNNISKQSNNNNDKKDKTIPNDSKIFKIGSENSQNYLKNSQSDSKKSKNRVYLKTPEKSSLPDLVKEGETLKNKSSKFSWGFSGIGIPKFCIAPLKFRIQKLEALGLDNSKSTGCERKFSPSPKPPKKVFNSSQPNSVDISEAHPVKESAPELLSKIVGTPEHKSGLVEIPGIQSAVLGIHETESGIVEATDFELELAEVPESRLGLAECSQPGSSKPLDFISEIEKVCERQESYRNVASKSEFKSPANCGTKPKLENFEFKIGAQKSKPPIPNTKFPTSVSKLEKFKNSSENNSGNAKTTELETLNSESSSFSNSLISKEQQNSSEIRHSEPQSLELLAASEPNSVHPLPTSEPNSAPLLPAFEPNSVHPFPTFEPNSVYPLPTSEPNSAPLLPASEQNLVHPLPTSESNSASLLPTAEPNSAPLAFESNSPPLLSASELNSAPPLPTSEPNSLNSGYSNPSDRISQSGSLAFTVDFDSDHKKLKHKRNLSWSKIKKRNSERTNVQKPPVCSWPRKSNGLLKAIGALKKGPTGENSEGYFSSDQDEDSAKKTELTSPRSGVTSVESAFVSANSQESNAEFSMRMRPPSPFSPANSYNTPLDETASILIEKIILATPELKRKQYEKKTEDKLERSKNKTSLSESVGLTISKEKKMNSSLIKDENFTCEDFDEYKDDISESGTYIIEKQSSKEDLTRNDLDNIFENSQHQNGFAETCYVPNDHRHRSFRFSTIEQNHDEDNNLWASQNNNNNTLDNTSSSNLSRTNPNWIHHWAAHVAQQTYPQAAQQTHTSALENICDIEDDSLPPSPLRESGTRNPPTSPNIRAASRNTDVPFKYKSRMQRVKENRLRRSASVDYNNESPLDDSEIDSNAPCLYNEDYLSESLKNKLKLTLSSPRINSSARDSKVYSRDNRILPKESKFLPRDCIIDTRISPRNVRNSLDPRSSPKILRSSLRETRSSSRSATFSPRDTRSFPKEFSPQIQASKSPITRGERKTLNYRENSFNRDKINKNRRSLDSDLTREISRASSCIEYDYSSRINDLDSDSSGSETSEMFKDNLETLDNSRSSDNHPPLKFNRAFSLRKARLNVEDSSGSHFEKKKSIRPTNSACHPRKTSGSTRCTPVETPLSTPRSLQGSSSMSNVKKDHAVKLKRTANRSSSNISAKEIDFQNWRKKSAKEVDFQNWKRRKSYDPMKAAAEGKKKLIEKRKIKDEDVEINGNVHFSRRSPSPQNSLHRSASFNGSQDPTQNWTKKNSHLNNYIYQSEEDGPYSLEEESPRPSPCRSSPLSRSRTSPRQLSSPLRNGFNRMSAPHSEDSGSAHNSPNIRKISVDDSASEARASVNNSPRQLPIAPPSGKMHSIGKPKPRMEALDNLVISTIHSLSLKVKTTSESLLQKLKSQYDEEGDRAALLDEVLSHLSESDQSLASGQTRSTSKELAGILRNLKTIEHALEVIDRVIVVDDGDQEGENSLDYIPSEWVNQPRY